MVKDLDILVSLCKRRGFIFPGSEIYGGLANSWDYGPLGTELKNNIKREWWKMFVQQRADMVGIDAALIMNPKVWEASGHLGHFTDPLVECKKCKNRFRADHLLDSFFSNNPTLVRETSQMTLSELNRDFSSFDIKCPNCDSNLRNSVVRQFNMMLKTFLGPAEERSNEVYFRPETAQAMFVDFANVQATSRKRLPFGIAQQGKAFRNEITPGNFIFRTREFEQMEIEYFVKESEWQKHFDMWLEQMKAWLKHLGVDEKNLHYVDIPDGERAHYSKRTVDIEYDYPFGQKELYGLAYRTDFDLNNHMTKSGQDMRYMDPESSEKFLPHVIEPTWGVDRSVLVAMLEAYHEEEAPTSTEGETEARVVMKFPNWLAPYKLAILPLSKKEELSSLARELHSKLTKRWYADYDETQSIGKRYRRQDEIGTPYCVTVDFDSIIDRQVTVRDRDTMKQERIPMDKLEQYLADKLSF